MVAIPEIKPFHGQQSRQPSWQDRQEKGSAFTTKSFLMCGWRWWANTSPAEDRGEEETKPWSLELDIMISTGHPLRCPRTTLLQGRYHFLLPKAPPQRASTLASGFSSPWGLWNPSYHLGKDDDFFLPPKSLTSSHLLQKAKSLPIWLWCELAPSAQKFIFQKKQACKTLFI